MTDKNQVKIVKFIKGTLGGAFDQAITTIPGVNIVWGAIKGGVSAIRSERALDFIDYFQSNFEESDLSDEEFVDVLGNAFEEFLRQRDVHKRDLIKKILLAFKQSKNKRNFEAERMFQLLNLLSNNQINDLASLSSFGVFLPPSEEDFMAERIENFSFFKMIGLVNPKPVNKNPNYQLTQFGKDFALALKIKL